MQTCNISWSARKQSGWLWYMIGHVRDICFITKGDSSWEESWARWYHFQMDHPSLSWGGGEFNNRCRLVVIQNVVSFLRNSYSFDIISACYKTNNCIAGSVYGHGAEHIWALRGQAKLENHSSDHTHLMGFACGFGGNKLVKAGLTGQKWVWYPSLLADISTSTENTRPVKIGQGQTGCCDWFRNVQRSISFYCETDSSHKLALLLRCVPFRVPLSWHETGCHFVWLVVFLSNSDQKQFVQRLKVLLALN